jgi:hypothetical protein
MHETTVEKILEMPPGDYSKRSRFNLFCVYPSDIIGFEIKQTGVPRDRLRDYSDKLYLRSWQGDDYSINVAFDEDERVVGCYLIHMLPPKAPKSVSSILRRLAWFCRWMK